MCIRLTLLSHIEINRDSGPAGLLRSNVDDPRMTTSPSISKPASMFGLGRRASTTSGNSACPTSAPEKSGDMLSPPSSSAINSTESAADINLSPSRRRSNNDKIMRHNSTSVISAANISSSNSRVLLRAPSSNDNTITLGPRSMTRDFALPVSPSSTVPHENCTSLREQFLQIKERFSGSSSIHTQHTSPKGKTATVTPMTTSEVPTSVPTDRILMELNERTKKLNSGVWPDHSHVERWFVEDNYFKGSLTCWTIEKGAEIIARIAQVTSHRPTSTVRINPDISLQWIGRQLWAVTVSLPLTRSGELTSEHAVLAQNIDDAIADEIKRAPQECGPRSVRMNPLLIGEDIRIDGSNQVGSVVFTPIQQDQVRVPLTSALDSESVPSLSTDVSAAIDEWRTHETIPAKESVSDDTCSNTNAVSVDEEMQDGDPSSRSQTLHEEADTLSALPLSWSMLSLQSSSMNPSDGLISLHHPTSGENDNDPCVPPDKTGWLKKKNGLNSWQTRYFELKGNRLFYFASESEGIPRGVIIMDHAHVFRGNGTSEQGISFTISASNSQQHIQVIKFSHRMNPQVHLYVV